MSRSARPLSMSARRVFCWMGLAALVLLSGAAQAHRAAGSGRRIVPDRWFLCRDEPAAKKHTPPAVKSPTGELLEPVPLRSRPSRHQAIPDRADEVAVYDPLPTGSEQPVVPLQKETAVIASSSGHSYMCLGKPRGAAGIARFINAPSGTRAYENAYSDGTVRDYIAVASILNVRAAIEPLRRRLTRPIPPPDPERYLYQYLEIRDEVAIALSDMGDLKSAAAIAAMLRQTEESQSQGWEDVLRGLGRLDAKAAESYSIGFLNRLAKRKRKFVYRSEHASLRTLDYLTAQRRDEVIGALRKLTASYDDFEQPIDKHGFCRLTAARARIGEEPYRSEVRRKLHPSVPDGQASQCFSEWLDATFGYAPQDVDFLLTLGRYDRFNQLVDSLLRGESSADQAERARISAAKQKLLAGLQKLNSSARVSKTWHNDYSLGIRVWHYAALAGLGDSQAVSTLYGHIDDKNDDTDAAWDGAYWAVRFGVVGAIDHALALIRTHLKSRRNDRGWMKFTGWIDDDARVRLLDELVRRLGRSDPRWAIALLNHESDMQEKALYHLTRLKPAGACEAVADAVADADSDGVDGAFWALSVLDKACEKTMLRLARDGSKAKIVRGMAVELLAMMRSPHAAKLIRRALGNKDVRYYANRARVINASPE